MCRIKGFTLIELMIVSGLIALFLGIAIPSYRTYLIQARRMSAEFNLEKMVLALEEYYTVHTSFEGANVDTLNLAALTHQPYYTFVISELSNDQFTLSATPIKTNDPLCGTLLLNNSGEKQITGTGSVDTCW